MRLHGLQVGRPLIGPETVRIDLAAPGGTRLTIDELSSLIPELAGQGVERIYLGDLGEPVEHPDLSLTVELVRSHGMALALATSLLHSDPERLAGWPIEEVVITFPGHDEDSYLALHPEGRLEDWLTMLQKLARLRHLGVRPTHRHILSGLTLRGLPEMVKLASRFHAPRLILELPQGPGETGAAEPLGRSELGELTLMLPKVLKSAVKAGVRSNLAGLAERVRARLNKSTPTSAVGCRMGFFYARVRPGGSLHFCDKEELKVGMLERGRGFPRHWSGQAWNELRDRLAAGRFYPCCARCGRFDHNRAIRKSIEVD